MVEYCSAAAPLSAIVFSVARESSWSGKNRGLGSPPAKEMMEGSSVTLRISRTKDLRAVAILRENLSI